MKRVIRLTESELHGIIRNAAMRVINEGGGVYRDGQMDLFFGQDELDDFSKLHTENASSAIEKTNKECGWRTIYDRDCGNYIEVEAGPNGRYVKNTKEYTMALMKRVPNSRNVTVRKTRPDEFSSVRIKIKKI